MSDASGRRSTESLLSTNDYDSAEEHTPLSESNEIGSTTRLVIMPTNDDDGASLAFSEDEDDPVFLEAAQNTVQPAQLSSLAAFVYFASAHFKLGSMLMFGKDWPLKLVLPVLFASALLSAFARQLWFLLARYVRKGTVEDILLEAFVRGRRGNLRKALVRNCTKFGSGLLRILLAVAYLRESVDVFLPNVVGNASKFLPRSLVAAGATLVILLPLCAVSTLSSRRVIFSTSASIVFNAVWLLVITVTRAKGLLEKDALVTPPKGVLWQSITTIAFTFTSVSSVQIYSTLIGSISAGSTKEKRFMSITWLSIAATAFGTLLVLPLAFMQYPGSDSEIMAHQDPLNSNSLIDVKATLATLEALTLVLGIPPLLVSAPALPFPSALRRMVKLPLSKLTQLLIVFTLSIVPTHVMSILLDITLVLALASTFFLPALAHMIHHQFRRPLSIIVQRTDHSPTSPTHDRSTDELLLRKEQALQRRRLGRRIIWDIGVWTLLIPIGLGGFVWAVGRVARKW